MSHNRYYVKSSSVGSASVFNTPPNGVTRSWANPFAAGGPNSGAVLVGAGDPPAGTNGNTSDPVTQQPYVDRARCGFSNYGSRVDAQGWGFEVVTLGYGYLFQGNDDVKYTSCFSGTSSGAPIVAGALACIQGALRAKGAPLLTPAAARNLLRATGSPQQDAPNRPANQRVGNRPDLTQMIAALGL